MCMTSASITTVALVLLATAHCTGSVGLGLPSVSTTKISWFDFRFWKQWMMGAPPLGGSVFLNI